MAKSKQNGHGHITETPDVSHIKNVDVTHELSDVNVPVLLKFVLGLTVMTIGVYLLMWLLFGFFNKQEAKKELESAPGPMAMTEQESLPPEPRLQAAPGFGVKLENGQWVTLEKREPQAEYQALREQWQRLLTEGAKDPSGKPINLPIEEAMEKVLEGKGLPSRSQEGGTSALKDYSASTPTAASSGRLSMKGTQ